MSEKKQLELSDEFLGLDSNLSDKFKKLYGNKIITGDMVSSPIDTDSEDSLYSDLSDEDFIDSTQTSGLLSQMPVTQTEEVQLIAKKKRGPKLKDLSEEEKQQKLKERREKIKEYQKEYQKEYRVKYRRDHKQYYAEYLKQYINKPEYKEHRKEYVKKNKEHINKLHAMNHKIKTKVFTIVREMIINDIIQINSDEMKKKIFMLYEAFEDKSKYTDELVK